MALTGRAGTEGTDMQKTMTLDEALDFADDAYFAGNIAQGLPSDATVAEVEAALAPWNVKVVA